MRPLSEVSPRLSARQVILPALAWNWNEEQEEAAEAEACPKQKAQLCEGGQAAGRGRCTQLMYICGLFCYEEASLPRHALPPTTYISSEIHCLFMLFSSIVSWFFCCSVVVVFIVINISLPLAVRGGRNCVLFSYTCAPLCVCVCVRVSFCVCVRVYVSVEECSGIENGCVAAARNGVVYFNIAYFWAFYYIKL